MPRPPLTEQQRYQAHEHYYQAREQAVRFVLSALDATAFNAQVLPYPEVLARVQALIAHEIAHYAEPEAVPEADVPPAPAEEDPTHG